VEGDCPTSQRPIGRSTRRRVRRRPSSLEQAADQHDGFYAISRAFFPTGNEVTELMAKKIVLAINQKGARPQNTVPWFKPPGWAGCVHDGCGAIAQDEFPISMPDTDYSARLRQLVEQCRRAARNSFEVEAKGAFRTIGEELSNMADGDRSSLWRS
jgi:hypothetical protein